MSTAFTEFLTENEQRNYPFVEDAALEADTLFLLPQNAVLDLRGFHRTRPEVAPCLKAVVGQFASFSVDYPFSVGFWTFYFEMGPSSAPIRIPVRIPIDNINWPLHVSVSVADPIYPSAKIAVINVVFGTGVKSIPYNELAIFSDAEIEPAIFASLYRSQVDSIKVIHESDTPEFVGGDVVISGGYSTEVFQDTEGSIITVDAVPGIGPLGRFNGNHLPAGSSVCDGAVLSFNGILPNSKGEFTIRGGAGIEVVNLPLENKIQIRLLRTTMTNPTCA